MAKPAARRATAWPMEPKPMMPRVLRHVLLGQLPAQREHDREGLVGDRLGDRAGRVGDDHARLGRGPHVDAVVADAPAGDRAQLRQRTEDAPLVALVARHRRRTAIEQAHQLVSVQRRAHRPVRDLEAGLDQRTARLRLVLDKGRGHHQHASGHS